MHHCLVLLSFIFKLFSFFGCIRVVTLFSSFFILPNFDIKIKLKGDVASLSTESVFSGSE